MESTGQKPLPGNSVLMVNNKDEKDMDPQRLTGKLFIDREGANRVSGVDDKVPIFSI
jgi:hypothetical protein